MTAPHGQTTTLASGHVVTVRPVLGSGTSIEIGAAGTTVQGYLPGTAVLLLTLEEARALRTLLTAVIVNQGGS